MLKLRSAFRPAHNIVVLAFVFLCASVATTGAQQKLVMIGGGTRPPAALERFVRWAGGERARVLVVTWATQEPQESFEAFVKDLSRYRTAEIIEAPRAPLNGDAQARLLTQLKNATGIYFTGGDQVRIMDACKAAPSVTEALRERYRAGIVFAGTSAGTAIMSERMITGEGDFTVIDASRVETREGLGLLPGVIVDQHFIKRQRENRLFGLILANVNLLGIGIDEGTALAVTDNRTGEVIGNSQVMTIDGRKIKNGLAIRLYKAGEKIKLTR